MDQSDPHPPQSQSDWAVKATSSELDSFFPSQSDFYFNSTFADYFILQDCRRGDAFMHAIDGGEKDTVQPSRPRLCFSSPLSVLCFFLLLGVRSSVTGHCTPCGPDQFLLCIRSFGTRLPTCMYDPPLRSDDLKCICTSCVLGVVIILFVFTCDVSVRSW